jgi:hypothetical protein
MPRKDHSLYSAHSRNGWKRPGPHRIGEVMPLHVAEEDKGFCLVDYIKGRFSNEAAFAL